MSLKADEAMPSNFDQKMNAGQIKWRKKHITNRDQGEQNGKKRDWILPKTLWKEGLWPGISESLPVYLSQTGVQKHDGAHNLKSSWILCSNLYFPFRQDTEFIAYFLKEHVSSKIQSVIQIELEYESQEESLKPSRLLGEKVGQRGRNQTSPDVAFLVKLENGSEGLVLTEVKFTEHSFYGCSGRKKEHDNPDPRRCMNMFDFIYKNRANQCYQLQWGNDKRTNRKYWDYLKFTPEAFQKLKRCPAATAGYQLFRQQALAEALAQKGRYELVISCVAHDARNETLIRSLHGTGIDDFTTGWGSLFEGKAKFATFTHQRWVSWVKEHDIKGRWSDWLTYVEERYGFA